MTHGEILRWLRESLAAKLGVAPAILKLTARLDEHGLDSLEAVNFTAEIERKLARRIDPTALWEHGTLWELSTHLAELQGVSLEYPESEAELDEVLALHEAVE